MYQEIAIVAPTASGKTAVAISLAKKLNCVVLSLDSLAVYKKIDIASAKPTSKEMDGVVHFGIDKVYPDQKFDVVEFIQEYNLAKQYAQEHKQNLIIVGGTGFYLKSLLNGLSPTPMIDQEVKSKTKEMLQNLEQSYIYLSKIDPLYMEKIKPQDKYRIEKALELYLQTNTAPTQYFKLNKPKPIINDLKIYEIETNPDILRQRIQQRTKLMINSGIIDEAIELEHNYTREPNCFSSIGITEVFDYLDSKLDKYQLEQKIYIHTSQLAKRQRSFNRTQFDNITKSTLDKIEEIIIKDFK